MTKSTVYLVKFDLGYYADKQPNYEWSYTDDPLLAKRFKTMTKAEERGYYGIHLIELITGRVTPKVYTIETWDIEEVMTLRKDAP